MTRSAWLRVLASIVAGVATGVLVRLLLLVATRPHSIDLPNLPVWQAGIAFAGGIMAALVVFMIGSSGRPWHLGLAFVLVIVSLGLRIALFNVRLAQQFIPDLWIK